MALHSSTCVNAQQGRDRKWKRKRNICKTGNFTIQKTNRVFSAIPIDQAHEQNNACIKSDGGAVGLIDKPSALLRWMVAGHKVAALIEDFEDAHQLM